MSDPFSCALIGESTLLIRCVALLVELGHPVLGVASADPAVARWVLDRGLVLGDPHADLSLWLAGQSFDYLFSVANVHVLPQSLLQRARIAAVNYHDGPLPRYAGLYATSWALINREPSHGVTWHLMTDVVDAGDGLVQQAIDIAPRETAFTLNAKCFDAGYATFGQLVEQLSTGRRVATKQDLAGRTYFSRSTRPAAASMLAWDEPAEKLDALVRGLDFGPYANPIGLPKLAIGANEFVVVQGLEVLPSRSQQPPGTILTNARGLTMATASGDVRLGRFMTIDGEPLSPEVLSSRPELAEGRTVPAVPPLLANDLTAVDRSAARHEAFWSARLADLQPFALPRGAPPIAAAHDERSATNRLGSALARIGWRVPSEVVGFLKEGGGRPIDRLLAAFGAYLGRIGGGPTFDIGLQVTLPSGADSVFSEDVPLRFAMDDIQTFAELVPHVASELALVGRRHTFARDLVARTPQLRSRPDLRRGRKLALVVALGEPRIESASERRADLVVSFAHDAESITAAFDPDVLEVSSIDRLLEQFATFLRALTANPAQRLCDVDILSEADRRRLLVEWNATRAAYPDACVQHLIEAQVARTPDAVALECGRERMTYRELNACAEALATRLRTLGVGPDRLVGVCLDRSVGLPVAILAVLKAGGAYLPLDPTFPAERLAFVASDARPIVILTESSLVAALPQLFGPHPARPSPSVICLDQIDGTALAGTPAPTDQADPATAARRLAYVLYTSGSTGQPKGVAIEHRSLVNFLESMRREPGLAASDTLVAVTPLSFDIAGLELWLPLMVGARIVVAPHEVAVDGRRLAELLDATGATVMQATPATWRMLVDTGWPGRLPFKALCGGEALSRDLAERLLTRTSELWNMYGPTETTVWSAVARVVAGQPITIGRPIANTTLHVLDRHGSVAPIDVPGELQIGGHGLARGYLNRPALTAEKFVPDSFGTDPDGRLYRTGDLVRRRADGRLEFLGRLDAQVKIRGHRIEPGEIEHALSGHENIREVAVVAREWQTGEKRLVAYVVPKHGPFPSGADLRAFLEGKLPNYMIPAAFVPLDALPLTPNGKVDRRALPAPTREMLRAVPPSAPADMLERELQDIWSHLLGLDAVGVADNFFDLGGDSMIAVRVFTEIERRTGKRLGIATLFRAPTIEALAQAVRAEGMGPQWTSLVPIQPHGSKMPFFCVHAAGGNVLYYRDLALRLGSDQPFYGLQAQGIDGRHPRHHSIAEAAAHYIKEIKLVQPRGPYLVGGASLGGNVAFEMACQLREQGEEVALTAIMDSHGPGYPQHRPMMTWRRTLLRVVERVEHHVVSLVLLEHGRRGPYLSAKLRKGIRQFRRFGVAGLVLGDSIAGDPTVPEHLRIWEDELQAALRRHQYRPYEGSVVLFRASHQPHGIEPNPTLGWERVVRGGIEVVPVPGHHGTIIAEPRVRFLAAALAQCLNRASERTRGKTRVA
jgi:amino acid adenylation domain-containing protein